MSILRMKKLLAVTLFCIYIPFAYGYTYTYWNGDKYVGGWLGDERHGHGTYTSKKSGNKHVGKWVMDQAHGHGTFTFGKGSKHSGDKYVGEFRYGKYHGQGTYTFADGKKIVGKFKEGKEWNAKYYKADGNVLGTYTEGKWCAGCGSTNSSSTATSSNSSTLDSSSPNIWCVVKGWPKATYMRGSECKSHKGKAFTSATKAIAEHERLNPAYTTSSDSNYDSAIELEYWETVKDSDDPDLLRAYLDEYPNGKFAPLARLKIKKLESN